MTMTADETAALAALRDAKTSGDRYSAIIAIGKASLTNLAPVIAEYLHDEDPELRSAAIRTLGFYWQISAYREVAEQMMREEPDVATRAVAVLAWAAYDRAARAPSTLRHLYQLVIDDTQPTMVRSVAYSQFFTVYLPNAVGRPKPASSLDHPVEDGIDWKRLDAAMRETGADRASETELARTTRIETRGPVASVSFTRGAFELRCDDKVWRGTLVAGTWERAVGAMELAGFPAPAAPHEGDVIAIACTRDGARGQLDAPMASSRYRDIIRIAGAVAGDLVPALGTAGPDRLVDTARREATMNVTQISYCHGNPHNPYSGRIELLLHVDDRFEASYEHRTRRMWHGTLVIGTFARALAALAAGGFPHSAPIGPRLSGTSLLELGREADGVWDRIRVGEDDEAYGAIDVIASSIICMLEPKLARMPPGATTPILELHQDA